MFSINQNTNLNDIVNLNFVYDDENNTQIDELVVGNAYSTYNCCNRVNMTVVDTGDYIVRQTKEYYILPQEKTKIIMLSGILNNLKDSTGFTSRMGIFDDHDDKTVDTGGNGIYIELTDNKLYLVIRYGCTDQNEIRVEQKCFSRDRLDGFGPSRYTLSRFDQLLTFRIEFDNTLRDSIKFFIYHNNIPYLIHEFKFCPNFIFCFNPNLFPIRFSIEKNDSNPNQAVLTQGPSSIQISGDYRLHKILKYHRLSTEIERICIKGFENSYSYFSIKLKNQYNRAVIRNFEPYIYSQQSADNPLVIEVYKNPTFTDPLVWTSKPNSMIEYSTTSTIINTTNAELVMVIYMDINKKLYNMQQESLSYENILTSNIEGVSDIMTVVITNLQTSSGRIHASFHWLETS
jgi:hypothetical protein